MRRILVATDFSPRSDRALRRAALLARQSGAELVLAHIVDGDQPPRLVRAERDAASALLAELCQTLETVDGLACRTDLRVGAAFEGILEAGEAAEADLVVLGAHRRQALRDVFIGTTAERAIRASRRPILMANATPAGFYRNLLVAVDLSPTAAAALRAVSDLGLGKGAWVTAAHAYAAPAGGLLGRAAVPGAQAASYLREEERRAGQALQAFLTASGLHVDAVALRADTAATAATICALAQDRAADLIVISTRGRGAAVRLLMGSVAQEVLRMAECDVLAVPPPDGLTPAPGPDRR